MKTLIRSIIAICIILMFSFIVYNQWLIRQDFAGHWHYLPKHPEIELAEYRLSQSVPYHLTKPKPRQSESVGYIYWSYGYCGR